jgi:uncharacterized protein YqhQ
MRRIDIGGQAVFEGVMLRGHGCWAAAVRRPDGGIELRVDPLPETRAGRIPVVRGLVALRESFTLGLRALVWSIGVLDPSATPQRLRLGRTVAGAIAIVVAGFVALPVAVAATLAGGTDAEHGIEVATRFGVLVAYLAGVGRVPAVRRLFEYHGAEHVVVSAYEAGAPLTVDGVRSFSTRHPRCGTSFLVVVAGLTSLLGLALSDSGVLTAMAGRLAFVPLAAGLGYEVLRAAGRSAHRRWVRALLRPLLAVQRLTTRAPSDEQLAVALAAMDAVLLANTELSADAVVPALTAPAPRVAPSL